MLRAGAGYPVAGRGRALVLRTPDWQVRYAVLRDLTLDPWPFAYQVGPRTLILRAPVGVFLFPALVGKLGLGAAQQALLAQNTVMLGTLMAMGSALFPTPRQRWIAAALF
jgi:hypothetical protein